MFLANKKIENQVKTFITYNKGRDWRLLQAPDTDLRGDPVHCLLVSLHMEQKALYKVEVLEWRIIIQCRRFWGFFYTLMNRGIHTHKHTKTWWTPDTGVHELGVFFNSEKLIYDPRSIMNFTLYFMGYYDSAHILWGVHSCFLLTSLLQN